MSYNKTAGTNSRPNTLKTRGVLHNIHILLLTKKRKRKRLMVSGQATAGLVPPNVTYMTEKWRNRERERVCE